jgi:ankyrin repeat protein
MLLLSLSRWAHANDEASSRDALHLAVLSGNTNRLLQAITKGTFRDNIGKDGETLLGKAVIIEDIPIITMLLNAGVDVALTNNKGETPLFLSLVNMTSNHEVSKLLRKAGGKLSTQEQINVWALQGEFEAILLKLDGELLTGMNKGT